MIADLEGMNIVFIAMMARCRQQLACASVACKCRFGKGIDGAGNGVHLQEVSGFVKNLGKMREDARRWWKCGVRGWCAYVIWRTYGSDYLGKRSDGKSSRGYFSTATHCTMFAFESLGSQPTLICSGRIANERL
jgi:hypothetical protein